MILIRKRTNIIFSSEFEFSCKYYPNNSRKSFFASVLTRLLVVDLSFFHIINNLNRYKINILCSF